MMFSRHFKHKESGPVPVRKSTGALTGVLQSRRVPLRGPLTPRTAACCINRMLVLAADNKVQPMVIEIDSVGGELADALSIIRTMNGIPCPVGTFCCGDVHGTAILVAAHGVRLNRVSLPIAQFSFASLRADPRNSDWQALMTILSKDTGREEPEIISWLAQADGFDPRDALARGLIDALGSKPLFPGHDGL